MHLVFDIFQGIGIAASVGIRPFLPALAVGALAAADVQVDFSHTSFSFLEGPIFLLVMLVGVVLISGLERRSAGQEGQTRLVQWILAVSALIIGALQFGGEMARGHHPVVIGIVAGLICAAVGILATVPLLGRVRARLDAEAAGALPLIAEATATVGAVLSVLLPPVGLVVLIALLWLLIAGRGRREEKYAGLRILR